MPKASSVVASVAQQSEAFVPHVRNALYSWRKVRALKHFIMRTHFTHCISGL